jgi:hypothetical protein
MIIQVARLEQWLHEPIACMLPSKIDTTSKFNVMVQNYILLSSVHTLVTALSSQ